MYLGILPKLTRPYILDRITQVAIFAKYLGISEILIHSCINSNKLIRSPLRVDKNPTCGFLIKSDGRICFNDFAGYFTGDCFDVVGYQNLLNADDSIDFNKILHIVAKDFKLHEYSNTNDSGLIDIKTYNNKKAFKIIDIVPRSWNYADINNWNRFNITVDILKYFEVFPVQTAYLNKKIIYHYTENDPCYAYYLGEDTKGVHWKLYFPRRKSYKFITNSNKVQGSRKIKEAKFGIITKSLKDVMALFSFGIDSVSVSSETTMMSIIEINYIKTIWNQQATLFDFDYAGITLSSEFKKYNIPNLFFTNGKYQTFNYLSKDFSDHVDTWGIATTQNLIDFIKLEGIYSFNSRNFQDFLTFNYQ